MSLFSGCNFICLNLSSISDTKKYFSVIQVIFFFILYFILFFRQICSKWLHYLQHKGRETKKQNWRMQKTTMIIKPSKQHTRSSTWLKKAVHDWKKQNIENLPKDEKAKMKEDIQKNETMRKRAYRLKKSVSLSPAKTGLGYSSI